MGSDADGDEERTFEGQIEEEREKGKDNEAPVFQQASVTMRDALVKSNNSFDVI